MIARGVVVAALLLAALALGAACNSDPDPWDCGSECVASCAFLGPKEHSECLDDCAECDGKDARAFVAPPYNEGLPAWLTQTRTDAGHD